MNHDNLNNTDEEATLGHESLQPFAYTPSFLDYYCPDGHDRPAYKRMVV
jgi:hypothetical protein